MSKTWKDISIHGLIQKAQAIEARRLAAQGKTLREAIAREKARNEVLLALTTGKLKAKQVKGNVYSGKAGYMTRAIRFDLNQVINLRAKDLIGTLKG